MLPQDLLTGQSMKHKQISDQEYVLYSVGWNGMDDGGKSGKIRFADAGDRASQEAGAYVRHAFRCGH
jgi:hypothetical protein